MKISFDAAMSAVDKFAEKYLDGNSGTLLFCKLLLFLKGMILEVVLTMFCIERYYVFGMLDVIMVPTLIGIMAIVFTSTAIVFVAIVKKLWTKNE